MENANNDGRALKIIRPEYTGPRIIAHIEPENQWLSMPRVKTAGQLLAALGQPEESALVARGRELLTYDRHIWPDDEIFVRIVGSRG